MSSAAPTVTVKQGKINGKEQKSVLNEKTFYSFQGIPYAKSPIGELRFQVIFFSNKFLLHDFHNTVFVFFRYSYKRRKNL